MRLVPPAYTPLPPAALLRLATPSAADEAALASRLLEEHGDGVATLVGSGTQALTLALSTLVPPGGAVGLPGWGCFDLASAAVGAGVGVRLYDMEPSTLQPDPSSLARVAVEVDVLVVVSFFGIPVEEARLPAPGPGRPVLVHDAAQAQGTRWGPDGVPWADATVLSFGRGKGWTGVGGGALLAHSARARAGLDAGLVGGAEDGRWGRGVRGAAQWLLGGPALYGLPARIPALGLGETLYHAPRPVTGLPRGAASVLLASRDAAEREAAFRRSRAAVLRARAEAGGRVETVRVEGDAAARAGTLRLPVLDPGEVDREAVRALGVLGSYPRPLRTLDALKPFLRAADPTPGSDRLARELLTLPTHSRTSPRDRARLEAWLDPSSASARS